MQKVRVGVGDKTREAARSQSLRMLGFPAEEFGLYSKGSRRHGRAWSR